MLLSFVDNKKQFTENLTRIVMGRGLKLRKLEKNYMLDIVYMELVRTILNENEITLKEPVPEKTKLRITSLPKNKTHMFTHNDTRSRNAHAHILVILNVIMKSTL